MVLAPIVFLAVFFALPLLWIGATSVSGVDPLSSYLEILSSPTHLRSLGWTFGLAAITAALTLVLGYPVAAAMVRSGPWMRMIILGCIMLPFWTSALVRTFAWTSILGRQGVVNTTLMALGLIERPLQLVFNPLGAIIGTTHLMLPYMIFALLANMQRIDPALMRGARSLGAGPLRSFFFVYLPHTMPGIASGLVLVFIISLGFFVTPAVLGGSQNPTVAVLIEQSMNKLLNFPMTAALATVLLVMTLILYVLFNRQIVSAFYISRTDTGAATATFKLIAFLDRLLAPLRRILPERVRAFGLRVNLNTPLALLIAIIAAVPTLLIVLIAFFPSHALSVDFSKFSLRWFEQYFGRVEWMQATAISIAIAAITAVITAILVLLAALGMRRLSGAARLALIPVFLSPVIVPSVVYGLASYFLFAQIGLIGNPATLVLAHTVLAIPTSFLLVLVGVQGLDERIENAAATLGATPWQRLRVIVLPILLPVVAMSALLAFLTSFDDLNVALFLASGNTKTLPKLIYDSIILDNDPRVTAASAVLVAISILGLGTMQLLRSRQSKR